MPLEQVTQVHLDGALYTFYSDRSEPLAFWRIETPGRESYRSPVIILGNETPEFFRRMAELHAAGALK